MGGTPCPPARANCALTVNHCRAECVVARSACSDGLPAAWIATPGSVAYQFDRKGEIQIAAEGIDDDRMMEAAILAGADDVQRDEPVHLIHTSPTELAAVASGLRTAGFAISSEKLVSVPQIPSVVFDPEVARLVMKLYDLLDGYDDTLNVFTNFEIADEVFAALDA